MQYLCFHATSRASTVQILKNGLGLSKMDYWNLIEEISDTLKMSVALKEELFFKHYTEAEPGVSLLLDLDTTKKIAPYYCQGGESKRRFVANVVKSWCQRSKVAYSQKKDLVEKICKTSSPAIVVAVVDEKDFVFTENAEEIYIKNKIPSAQIVKVLEL